VAVDDAASSVDMGVTVVLEGWFVRIVSEKTSSPVVEISNHSGTEITEKQL
jgi:hypothetical protein